MHKKDLGVGAVAIAFGAWVYYMTTTMKAKAAFWPRIVAYGIILLGAIILVSAVLGLRKEKAASAAKKKNAGEKSAGETTAKEKPNYLRVIAILAVLIVYYFLFTKFSYTIATMLLIISTSVILGYRNWKVLIPTAVILSVLLYVAFSQLFNVHFPGIFF